VGLDFKRIPLPQSTRGVLRIMGRIVSAMLQTPGKVESWIPENFSIHNVTGNGQRKVEVEALPLGQDGALLLCLRVLRGMYLIPESRPL